MFWEFWEFISNFTTNKITSCSCSLLNCSFWSSFNCVCSRLFSIIQTFLAVYTASGSIYIFTNVFLLKVILLSIWFKYIFIGGLSVIVSSFLMIYSKYSWIFETEYDSLGNSNFSFHVETDVFNVLFLYDFRAFFPV